MCIRSDLLFLEFFFSSFLESIAVLPISQILLLLCFFFFWADAYLIPARRVKAIAHVGNNNIKISILLGSRSKWYCAHFSRFQKTNQGWKKNLHVRSEKVTRIRCSPVLCGRNSARASHYQAWWKQRRIYLSVKWRSVQGAWLLCILVTTVTSADVAVRRK